MKKKIFKISLSLLLIFFFASGVFLLVNFISSDEPLSQPQQEVVRIFGLPQQFSIAYLPRGEAEVVRQEIWLYPQHEKRITFLAGDLVNNEDYQPPQAVKTPTSLRPQDFQINMDLDAVESILGQANIEALDYLPGFYEEGKLGTYVSTQAIFVIEDDFLTYFQTLDFDPEGKVEDEVEEPVEDRAVEASSKKYESIRLGFQLQYPSSWFLPEGTDVLTSYDPQYLEKGELLPETRAKCDFLAYRPEEDVAITAEQVLFENGLRIKKGTALSVTEVEGPSLGDAVIFLAEADGHETVSLLCYAYDDSFEPEILSMLKTITLEVL